MVIQQQKTNVEVSRTLRNTSFCCAHTIHNNIFNAATLSVVVASNLVALVAALIVSYPILLLTNNNRMMISVRRMLKKWQIKKLFVASSAATKTGENVEGQNAEGQIVAKRPKSHIREHDQHSFNSIRVLFADNFAQFGLSLPHNNQLDFALLTKPFRH